MKTARAKTMRECSDDRDKLSDLPDAILLIIMSFLKVKDAVQTCILSKRWKDLWKSLPNLTLHTSDFNKPSVFSEFVSGIVSCRDGNNPLHTLDFDRHGYFQHQILKSLMRYAVRHNVQQLSIYVPHNLGLSPCVFSCWSLTSLRISVSAYDIKRRTKIPRSLDLPALISLHLECVAISADEDGHAEPFSACNKLKDLYIDHCVVLSPNNTVPDKTEILNITNASLSSLAIDYTYSMDYKAVICTPNLSSFTINSCHFQTLLQEQGAKVEIQSPSLM